MGDAVTVWAVRLQGMMREKRGSLALEADAVAFTADDGYSHERIPLTEIRKARRISGSPILVIRHGAGAAETRTAFYFAQPPPLEHTGPIGRRKVRRKNVQYLGAWSREKGQELKAWERAVRQAAAAARR